AAKMDLLGVGQQLLIDHGAVSEPVAIAMAEGALARSAADLAIAITGIAGPGGGSAEKPEGLVHFACARSGFVTEACRVEFGALGRSAVRAAAVDKALAMLLSMAGH
ncbi:MAG: nicotinamide-nucleotide amidohydrolase family protein, partial [Pseudomonadota bacterium]